MMIAGNSSWTMMPRCLASFFSVRIISGLNACMNFVFVGRFRCSRFKSVPCPEETLTHQYIDAEFAKHRYQVAVFLHLPVQASLIVFVLTVVSVLQLSNIRGSLLATPQELIHIVHDLMNEVYHVHSAWTLH